MYVSICPHMESVTRHTEQESGYSRAESSPFVLKPQPRGYRQTPGTRRHSRAYLFNRMCYSITASLSQQRSFKYPFISGIRRPRASPRTITFVCLVWSGLCCWKHRLGREVFMLMSILYSVFCGVKASKYKTSNSAKPCIVAIEMRKQLESKF